MSSHLHGLWHRLRRTTPTKLSPCTNDGEMRHGKTWIRASTGQGLWTHGGSVKVDRGSGLDWFQIGDGMQMNTSECPSPVCERADPWRLHIYHYRCARYADGPGSAAPGNMLCNISMQGATSAASLGLSSLWSFVQAASACVACELCKLGLRARLVRGTSLAIILLQFDV